MTTTTAPSKVVQVWIEADPQNTGQAAIFIQRRYRACDFSTKTYPIVDPQRQHRAFQTIIAWAKRNPIRL